MRYAINIVEMFVEKKELLYNEEYTGKFWSHLLGIILTLLEGFGSLYDYIHKGKPLEAHVSTSNTQSFITILSDLITLLINLQFLSGSRGYPAQWGRVGEIVNR